jgi:hypothetical protein
MVNLMFHSDTLDNAAFSATEARDSDQSFVDAVEAGIILGTMREVEEARCRIAGHNTDLAAHGYVPNLKGRIERMSRST